MLTENAHERTDKIALSDVLKLKGNTVKKARKAKEEDISEIAIHLDCEHDVDSILHTIREIQADLEIAKEAAAPASAEPVGWQPISTYALVPRRGEYFPPHALCAHAEKKWIRMGRYEPGLKRWYYSGTNERSQWAQIEGDEPTHWMHLPNPPISIDT